MISSKITPFTQVVKIFHTCIQNLLNLFPKTKFSFHLVENDGKAERETKQNSISSVDKLIHDSVKYLTSSHFENRVESCSSISTKLKKISHSSDYSAIFLNKQTYVALMQ